MKSKTTWTNQQQNAINARNSSVIVSAAAGSGKTAVLTERLAQLIADEKAAVRADRIVVVTFTNDAASELRKRLDSKLRKLIEQNPGNRYLLKQQTLLQNAKISTINAFCFNLLRDYITDQGITSAFTILDDSDNVIIKAQAMDELINYYSSSCYDKISFMYDKFCLKDDEGLAEAINLADRYLSSAAMRDKWLESAVEEYSKNPCESLYFKKIVDSTAEKLKEAKKLADECQEMMDDIFDQDNEISCAVKSYAQAEDDCGRVLKAIDILDTLSKEARIPTEAEIAFCKGFERLVTVKSKEPVNFEAREFYKTKRKAMISAVKDAFGSFYSLVDEYEECGKVTVILAEMLKKYHELIWLKKCEKNAISFDDGERLVLELLIAEDSNGRIVQSETALKLSEYYDIIMIDEYQDSNNKQDLIFKLLSKNYRVSDEGFPIYGTNTFLVGDIKQSIYKFRLANPQNFINTLNCSEPYTENSADNPNVSIALNRNFRSSEGVINYVNFFFSNMMSESCGDIVYSDDERLYFGASEYSESSCNTLTQLSVINCGENDISDDDGDDESEKILSLSDSTNINPEAAYTAKKIYDMIREQTPVIDKNNTARPCKASDFCILIRKNKFAKDYIAALEKYGISAKGEEEKGYLSSREIAVLLDLLRIIDNPLLDIPMTAVMMSPMFMFDFEEIAFLKTFGKNRPLFSIMNQLVKDDITAAHAYESIIRRCRSFLDVIDTFRLCSVTMTIGQLIGKIYDTTDFIAVMQLYTDGEKKRANLRTLIQHAGNYEKNSALEGGGGLSGFLRYIDRMTENKSDFSQSRVSSSSGDYVSVKTIHKSKGLEYPFIFIAETSTRFKFDSPSVMCAEDGRIGFVLYNQQLVRRYKTLPYKQIKEENKRDILSEEMRLLYVAMTRAKQQLFINLKFNDKQLDNIQRLLSMYQLYDYDMRKPVLSGKCYSDWIWLSLFRHEAFSDIAQKLSIEVGDMVDTKSMCKDKLMELCYIDNIQTEDIETSNNAEEAQPDEVLCNQLKDIIDYQYNYDLAEIPAKLSVTQIAKRFEAENLNFKLKRPAFSRENSKLTGAEKGTAIHTFFQYCDFESASEDIEYEKTKMIDSGYLNEIQADSINNEQALAFFDSKLYSRICSSDNIWREKKFTVAVADLNISDELPEAFSRSDGMIKGIVDLVFEEENEFILVDYKSDRKVTEEQLQQRYYMQLKIYKSAMELTTGKKVSHAYLYSFELKKEIEIKL